jgi:DHA1 family chloramphenicol resistance protein-like MFS transporter
MAGSYATAALNVGAAAGPLIAATTLSTAVGNVGPLWLSGLLVAVALLIAFPLRTVIVAGRSTEVLR